MAEKIKVRYYVKKATIHNKMCPSCRGTGKVDRKIAGGGFKTESCIHCTNGIAPIEHMTDIDLVDALTELGIRFILPASMKPKDLTTEINTEKK